MGVRERERRLERSSWPGKNAAREEESLKETVGEGHKNKKILATGNCSAASEEAVAGIDPERVGHRRRAKESLNVGDTMMAANSKIIMEGFDENQVREEALNIPSKVAYLGDMGL
ncbi:hypothetical protein L6452_13787 [Arctium lappa]|uniref:Uncharacterized protein n=2 Tax=Arctium lappa TaxID=4217 RepID=A0ACB9CJA3_ARCLA|nr:hypothetical protein L6452_13786 [Arctium lappa]KAI3734321.1 hypothetical protein L6452_13787 [Arctium lappa]